MRGITVGLLTVLSLGLAACSGSQVSELQSKNTLFRQVVLVGNDAGQGMTFSGDQLSPGRYREYWIPGSYNVKSWSTQNYSSWIKDYTTYDNSCRICSLWTDPANPLSGEIECECHWLEYHHADDDEQVLESTWKKISHPITFTKQQLSLTLGGYTQPISEVAQEKIVQVYGEFFDQCKGHDISGGIGRQRWVEDGLNHYSEIPYPQNMCEDQCSAPYAALPEIGLTYNGHSGGFVNKLKNNGITSPTGFWANKGTVIIPGDYWQSCNNCYLSDGDNNLNCCCQSGKKQTFGFFQDLDFFRQSTIQISNPFKKITVVDGQLKHSN